MSGYFLRTNQLQLKSSLYIVKSYKDFVELCKY